MGVSFRSLFNNTTVSDSDVIMAAPPPQTVVIQQPAFGPDPMQYNCSLCNHTVQTTTSTDPNSTAWILGVLLCIVGCWPCCLIPCCIDSMKTTKHTCPKCQAFLGQHN